MSLSIGIVGLPNVGKSTLFTALTNKGGLAANYPFATIEPNVGVVPVPDARLDALANIDHPTRIVPATIEFVDIAGLVAGGMHQSPVPYADVVTTTTHKTLRGPRGGLILTNNAVLAKRINSAVFPGTQGGPLEHVIAAKAVCFGEALKPEFKDYARKIVENAQAMAAELQARGVKLVSGGTDNHLMLVDLRPAHLTGKEMEHRLDEVYITVNKNAIPNDPEKPFVTSGIRVGTPAVTSRGFKEEEMKVVGSLICQCARDDFQSNIESLRAQVKALTSKYPLYTNC